MAVPPWERGGSKKLNCFTLALLLIRSRSLAGRSLVTTEKSVNNLPGTEQLANRGKDRCTSGGGVQYAIGRRSEICPRGRHQSAAAVGKHDQQLETATSIIPTQQLERLPFERMTASNNLNPPRVAVEMMVVMGSVSTIPSTTSLLGRRPDLSSMSHAIWPMLWQWARLCHRNKSKRWVRARYFTESRTSSGCSQ